MGGDLGRGMISNKVWRSAGGIAVITVLSRVTGYIRDKVMAYLMGAGMYSDAFIVAYRVPNMLRGLLAEGALHASFIPLFSEIKRTKPHELWAFAARVFYLLTFIASGLVVLGILFSPQIVGLMARDFGATPGKLELTSFLNRVMFPYLAFISLAGLLQGILNVFGRFYLAAATPMFLNAATVAGGVCLAPFFENPATPFAIGAVAGGFLQFFSQLVLALKLGFTFQFPKHLWTPEVGELLRKLTPGIFALGVYEISQFIGTRFAASAGDAAVTYLFYSYRLMHFIYGGFIVSLFTVLLPTLSSLVEDKPKFHSNLSTGFQIGFFITLPAVAGMSILSVPVIRLLFEGGRFTAADTPQVAAALVGYSLSLIPYAASKLLISGYFAYKNTRLPAWGAFYDLCIFSAACFVLVPAIGHLGVAWATTLGGMVQFIFLFGIARRHLPEFSRRAFLKDYFSLLAFNIPFAGLLFLGAWGLRLNAPQPLPVLGVKLAALLLAFIALYMSAGLLIKVRAARLILEMIRVKKG
jgi:putative peptidoglycan lipid II flippase